jgi:hypothetical protein
MNKRWQLLKTTYFQYISLNKSLVENGPLAWAMSPQNDLAVREALVPARNEPLVPV